VSIQITGNGRQNHRLGRTAASPDFAQLIVQPRLGGTFALSSRCGVNASANAGATNFVELTQK